jgi:cohesin complex subunit SA-1/2
LVVNLDDRFIETINRFVVQNVFEVSQEAFEKLDQQSQIELTCKRRVVLGQYCKLIMYGLLPIVDISLVLRFYQSNYADYGDIFKHMITRCREMNRLALAQAIIRSLKAVYEDMREAAEDNYVDTSSDEFEELRSLAKKFAGHFTGEQVKNREAIALIHQIGIRFALGLDVPTGQRPGRGRRHQPAEDSHTISFFEILLEFSSKLLRHDKSAV